LVLALSWALALVLFAAPAAAQLRDAGSAGPAGSAAPPSRPHADAPPGIDWFDGGVDAAFAKADAEHKPVFLYWGAVWCPYCADLKAHVFSRTDFKEKLKLFVPVYLDGDDPGAQKWGDVFSIAGYPTVLALGPGREELARIAGGMDLGVYTEVLDLVLGDLRPIVAVLASARVGGGPPLTRDDCRRLAYNGWALEDLQAPGELALAEELAAAADRCPADDAVERARLTVLAAAYAVSADTAENAAARDANADADADAEPDASGELVMRLAPGVREIVANRTLAASILDALLYLDDDFFAASNRLAPETSAKLLSDWSAAMDAALADHRFTAGDRLMALYSKLSAVKTLGPAHAIPLPLAAESERLVDDALAEARSTPALPGVVNAALYVLTTIGRNERAYDVAEQAMHASKTPYYYMADLADLDEEMGRIDAALGWLERAYDESQGPATRFEWGTAYVRGLIRMRPDDEAAVRDAAIEVLGELEGPDRIHTRVRTRLGRLDTSLREWGRNGRHADALAAIRGRMDRICTAIPAGDAQAGRSCRAFLAPAG
jgi:thiol-disulfide isomerase/thioredoxin